MVVLRKYSSMEKLNIHGPTEQFMKVIGKEGKCQGKG